MSKQFAVRASCFVAALALVSCVSMPPGWQADTDSADLIYAPLEIHFPAQIRDWVRTNPVTYDHAGLDVSVGYTATKAPLILDLYIYLRSYYDPSDLEGHFQSCLESIRINKPGSTIVSQEPTEFPIGSAEVLGLRAFVRQTIGDNEIGSYAVLLPYGERFVYLRVSFKDGDKDWVVQSVWETMKVFMREIDFPIEPLSG